MLTQGTEISGNLIRRTGEQQKKTSRVVCARVRECMRACVYVRGRVLECVSVPLRERVCVYVRDQKEKAKQQQQQQQIYSLTLRF